MVSRNAEETLIPSTIQYLFGNFSRLCLKMLGKKTIPFNSNGLMIIIIIIPIKIAIPGRYLGVYSPFSDPPFIENGFPRLRRGAYRGVGLDLVDDPLAAYLGNSRITEGLKSILKIWKLSIH